MEVTQHFTLHLNTEACISKSTKMCQSMTDFHRVCNVPTVDYSIPEAPVLQQFTLTALQNNWYSTFW